MEGHTKILILVYRQDWELRSDSVLYPIRAIPAVVALSTSYRQNQSVQLCATAPRIPE